MIRTLARNPLLRSLTQNWWLPVLVAPFFVAFLGAPALAALLPLLFGAMVVGIAGAACAHAGLAALQEGLRHERHGHRFLCPHCLRFGEFRYACGACGHEVDPLIVHTRGAYVNDCAECGAHLCARDGRMLAMKGRHPTAEMHALPAGWRVLALHDLRVPGLAAERCVVEIGRAG